MMYNNIVTISQSRPTIGESMSAKLAVPRAVDNLLQRMSPRYTVTSELARLDVAPVEDLSAAERLRASIRFNQLVGAERLKRRLAQSDQQLAVLRDSGLQQVEYETLLNHQLSTAKALYDVLRRVSRVLVLRPDGTCVRVYLVDQMNELYKRMGAIRQELEGPERPQDI